MKPLNRIILPVAAVVSLLLLVTIYLDQRIKRFIQQVNDVLDQSETAQTSDFLYGILAWREFDEVLDRCKRLSLRRI